MIDATDVALYGPDEFLSEAERKAYDDLPERWQERLVDYMEPNGPDGEQVDIHTALDQLVRGHKDERNERARLRRQRDNNKARGRTEEVRVYFTPSELAHLQTLNSDVSELLRGLAPKPAKPGEVWS